MSEFEKLSSEDPLYLVRIDPDLRAIARVAEGTQAEILDIVHHDTLAQFATNKS